jgi:type IV pilus assembly protein PilB
MVQIAKLIRKKMGEVLVDEGLLKDDQVQETLRRQRATGESFGEILVSMAFVTEMDIARTLVKQSGLPYIDASRYRINKDGIQAVPAELLWQNQIIVLDKIGKTMLVAISTVISPEILEKLERVSGSQIFVYVSTWSQIQMALEKNVPLPGKGGEAKTAPAKPALPPAAAAATAVRPVSPPSGTMPAVAPLRPGTQIRK